MENKLNYDENQYLKKLISVENTHPVIITISEKFDDVFFEDIDNYKNFLTSKGLPNLDTSNSEIVVEKKVFLDFLNYHKQNKCLAITNCFGFDNEISKGGKPRLMQKGIICRNRENMTDFELYKSFYTNKRGFREYFTEFNLNNKITIKEFKELKKNFKSFYSMNDFRLAEHGYALPIEGMIKILTDNKYLGKSGYIKFSFGLTKFNKQNIGNFSLYVSDENISDATFYIVCRNTKNSGSSGSCPPKIPCQ